MSKRFNQEPGCETIAQADLKELIGRKVDAGVRRYSYHPHLTAETGIIAYANDDPSNEVGIRYRGDWSIPVDIYRIYPETYAIKDQVIRDEKGTLWLIEEATDMETAERAILTARVSGSIGATESVEDGTTREISKFADVSKVVKVKAYGAK